MRIVCVASDASRNPLVRMFPIAKVLERNHEVVVTGFRSSDGVFTPYKDEFEYRTLKVEPLPRFLRQVGTLIRHLKADAVYVFKPLATSLWPGILARRRLDVPLLLDIEDWELGWYLDRTPLDQLKHLIHIRNPNSYLWTAVNEQLARAADHKFVVSRFLQDRFGGTLLRHGADTSFFDPDRWDREDALEELGLPDHEYVVFTGTPMPNKGLEDLVSAIERLGRPETRLLVVGSTNHDPEYCSSLVERFGKHILFLAPRPHADMPMILGLATVVALPQRVTRETMAQVPGKVFEAMAMGRPVVATAVSDLPEILDGCGSVVPPDDSESLVGSLERLLDDRALRAELGSAARRKAEAEFSYAAMEKVLEEELARVSRP
jgi:glycosyltransferase involved in cell wall biosynthesis